MGKNDFLARQRKIQQAYFDEGLRCGRQHIVNMAQFHKAVAM